MLNEQFNLDLSLPLVYASRQYAAYRDEYRDKVAQIVLNNNQETWEDWIYFNIKRIQDGIFYNMNSLDYLDRNNPSR